MPKRVPSKKYTPEFALLTTVVLPDTFMHFNTASIFIASLSLIPEVLLILIEIL